MGFFSSRELQEATGKQDNKFYHRMECKGCPLNTCKENEHPKMQPSGAAKPIVYILGEAPGRHEDEQGRQFVGASGQFLRSYLPKELRAEIRYNNTIRCRPPNNRDPEEAEIESCRPSIEKDIAASKPAAIFGMGGVPLRWALGQSGIAKWRGRKIPVQIGGHICWYFPMLHPSYIIRLKEQNYGLHEMQAHAFRLDLEHAFDFLGQGRKPALHTPEVARKGVQVFAQPTQDNLAQIEKLLARASASTKAGGVDFETSALRPYRPDARLLSFGISTDQDTFSFPYDHPRVQWPAHLFARLKKAVIAYLKSDSKKAVHKLCFELEWIGHIFGRDILRTGAWEDTESQAAILDERVGEKPQEDRKSFGASCFGLGFLTLLNFGVNIKDLTNINTKKIVDEHIPDMLFYNGLDGRYHRLLYLAQHRELKDAGLLDTYNRHKRRLPTIVLTQLKGVPVDTDEGQRQHRELTKQCKKAADEIAADPAVKKFEKTYRDAFNTLSNDHCVKLVRDILQRKEGEQKNGSYKVNKTVLSAIRDPIGKKILALRQPSKLLSTYIWTRESLDVYPDSRLHPILNPNFAETGRLTSEAPNEQNMPKHAGDGKKIRKQIRAPKGHVIFSLDYGQIEARCIAMASRDKVFVDALWNNYDIHMEWARKIAAAHFGEKMLADKDAMKKYRQTVKGGWVFAGFFDARMETMARQAGIPPDSRTKKLFDEFWDTFNGVRQWQNRLKDTFEKKGYVETLQGRRRRAPLSPNQVVNSSIQGLAADIVIDGMNALSELGDWDLQPILNVHDDLTSIFPEDRFEELSYTAVDILLTQKYDFLNVPLVVEASVGENLYEMKDAGIFSSKDWCNA